MDDNQQTAAIAGSTTIEVVSGAFLAGKDMGLSFSVACDPVCDLRGKQLIIKDHDGAEAGRIDFADFDGTRNTTGESKIKAPAKTGGFAWTAIVPAHTEQRADFAEAALQFKINVKAHKAAINVWGAPPAIGAGEKFAVKVGIKCPEGCGLAGREFEIYDHARKQVGAGKLGKDHWPGSKGLHYGEIELTAPPSVDRFTWEARIAWADEEMPHAPGSASFGIRTAPAADHTMTVEIVDKETLKPVGWANVVMHPYRGTTDAAGLVDLKVAKGEYTLLTSKAHYIAVSKALSVVADGKVRIELTQEEDEEDPANHYL